MNNPQNWRSYVKNYGMIRILMKFYTIMIIVVFSLCPTLYKHGDIWAIIIIIRIKYEFMIVTSYIWDTALKTLETRKSRCRGLGSWASGCVANFNYAHNSNVLY